MISLQGCSKEVYTEKWKSRFFFLEKQLKKFQPKCITSIIQTDRKKAHLENMMKKAVKQVALNQELWKI